MQFWEIQSNSRLLSLSLTSACNSEQLAARALGYTQLSWDNLSGKETQPFSSIKYWFSLTENEKAAAAVLGFTQVIWDNASGSVTQPIVFSKSWTELATCADGEDIPILNSHPICKTMTNREQLSGPRC